MSRVLTEKQYQTLRVLGSGAMLVSGGSRRAYGPLFDRGLVDGELGGQGCFINGVRITPAGLRALADAVERYGLPEIPKRETGR